MAKIIKLGTLYLDDIPAECGVKVNGRILTIGDTHTGHELVWVKVNGLLVADHVICTNVSWEQLDDQRLIRGKPIWIDGVPYLCRSLQVGGVEDRGSEWDTILDIAGESDDLWHWKNMLFWGQDKVPYACAVVRGYDSARSKDSHRADIGQESTGFRPVLEPLSPGNELSELLVGATIKAYGPEGLPITGTVQQLSDYDLFLLPTNWVDVPRNSNWCARQEDGSVIMDRFAIAFSERGG